MQISDEMKALEALARAYDHEEAACMGEPSPWVSADAEGDDEWKAERIAAARAGLEAYRSALSLPVQPVACPICRGTGTEADYVGDDMRAVEVECNRCKGNGRITTPPVPPTKGPEDDLIAARAGWMHGRNSWCPAGILADAERTERDWLKAKAEIEPALLALRSRPASALPVVGEPAAWADVIAERKRQVEKEGWTPEHDDAHDNGELARAGAGYAFHAGLSDEKRALGLPQGWPAGWAFSWWKPTTRRRDLVKAGALILAEIERLDRADALTPSVQP